MPDVPRNPADFTDTRIVAAIEILTDILRKKEMTATFVSPGESVNFDQFRMADALI
jgi:putative NADH-flavin reductase